MIVIYKKNEVQFNNKKNLEFPKIQTDQFLDLKKSN